MNPADRVILTVLWLVLSALWVVDAYFWFIWKA